MPKMLNRIKPIIKKEFRQITRDRGSFAVLLFIPAFMLMMFGYALNFDVRHIKIAVCDRDKSRLSREFINNFIQSEYFDLAYYLDDEDEIDRLMAAERVRVALVIPPDFSRLLHTGKDAKVQIIVDGANASAAATTIGYVNMAVQDYSEKITARELLHSGFTGELQPIDFRPRIWYNPELLSIKFLIPGLIGFIMMIMAVVSTALSVVKEKERGTMEQLIVSPLKPVELIIGKTIPFLCIALTATLVILIVGYALFGVVVKGSFLLLGGVTLLFLIGSLGLGLLISTIAETQQVAFMMSLLMTFLPTFLLSGFVFPIRNMPVAIQAVTYFVPARYFLEALRSIILKGAGLSAFWEQIVFLIIFAVLTITFSSYRLSKELTR